MKRAKVLAQQINVKTQPELAGVGFRGAQTGRKSPEGQDVCQRRPVSVCRHLASAGVTPKRRRRGSTENRNVVEARGRRWRAKPCGFRFDPFVTTPGRFPARPSVALSQQLRRKPAPCAFDHSPFRLTPRNDRRILASTCASAMRGSPMPTTRPAHARTGVVGILHNRLLVTTALAPLAHAAAADAEAGAGGVRSES